MSIDNGGVVGYFPLWFGYFPLWFGYFPLWFGDFETAQPPGRQERST